MVLYSLDETAASERLDAEAKAAVTDSRIRDTELAGYAGSWFDADTLRLLVASKVTADFELIERMGATPVAATWSLNELEQDRGWLAERLAKWPGGTPLVASHVEYQSNRVVVAVTPESLDEVRKLVTNEALPVHVEPVQTRPAFSSVPVRGGDGMRNLIFITYYSHPGNCSIGVAVNQGFLTAGHCTYGNNPTYGPEDIRTPILSALGQAQNSTFTINGSSTQRDAAWVQTSRAWTPVPEINGYASGILPVPAEWSATLEAAVGSTVCRYGETSGGPFCGTVSAKNVTVCFGAPTTCDTISGLTAIANSCTDNGDSGGPHRALANGQLQGLNVGGTTTNNCTGYPLTADTVYLQPIAEAATLMNRTVLTGHGAAAPTVQGLYCESPGWSSYFCYFSTYRSQGMTTLFWQSNQGGSGSGSVFTGVCQDATWPIINLTLGNPYGNHIANTSFLCRGGPPL